MPLIMSQPPNAEAQYGNEDFDQIRESEQVPGDAVQKDTMERENKMNEWLPVISIGVASAFTVWRVLANSREKVLRELHDIRRDAQGDRKELKKDILDDISAARRDFHEDFGLMRGEIQNHRQDINFIRKEVSDLRYRIGRMETGKENKKHE